MNITERNKDRTCEISILFRSPRESEAASLNGPIAASVHNDLMSAPSMIKMIALLTLTLILY